MRLYILLSPLVVMFVATLASGQIFTTGRLGEVSVIPGTEAIEVGPGMVVDVRSLDYVDLAGFDLTGSTINTRSMERSNLEGKAIRGRCSLQSR